MAFHLAFSLMKMRSSLVLADERAVGGDFDDVELVDFHELVGFGHGGAGHAGDAFVEFEEVLQRDGGHGLGFGFDVDAFLGFDGLVEAVGPLPADHEAAGEFIDDDDFAVLHDVFFVFFVDDVGAEGLLEQVRPVHVAADVEAADAGVFLGFLNAFVGEVDGFAVEFDLVHLHFFGEVFLGFDEFFLGGDFGGFEGFGFGGILGILDVAFEAFDFSLGGFDGEGERARRACWLRSACGRLRQRTCSRGASSWAGPEMMSGVRASSMRMESTSSTMAKSSLPCT